MRNNKDMKLDVINIVNSETKTLSKNVDIFEHRGNVYDVHQMKKIKADFHDIILHDFIVLNSNTIESPYNLFTLDDSIPMNIILN